MHSSSQKQCDASVELVFSVATLTSSLLQEDIGCFAWWEKLYFRIIFSNDLLSGQSCGLLRVNNMIFDGWFEF